MSLRATETRISSSQMGQRADECRLKFECLCNDFFANMRTLKLRLFDSEKNAQVVICVTE